MVVFPDHTHLLFLFKTGHATRQHIFNGSNYFKVSEYDPGNDTVQTADQQTAPKGRGTGHRKPQTIKVKQQVPTSSTRMLLN